MTDEPTPTSTGAASTEAAALERERAMPDGGLTTREKMIQLATELRTMTTADAAPEARQMVELLQVAAGMRIDVFAWLIPDTDAEADQLVDAMLALFVRVRGDDLPPVSLTLYGEHEPPPTGRVTAKRQ